MQERCAKSERLGAIASWRGSGGTKIRNPLASLSGAVELLAADLPNSDALADAVADRQRRLRDESPGDRLPDLPRARAGTPARPVPLRGLFDDIAELVCRATRRSASR